MPIPRVILAEYFCTPGSVLLFIIRSDIDQPHIAEIAIPLDQLRAFVVANFGRSEDYNRVLDLDETRYQHTCGPLIEPLRAWADEGDIVWLVPHDVLHYLPLHALQLDGRALIDRNPVCYTPNVSVMKHCRERRRSRRKTALVIGDSRKNLPDAHEEALTVAALFGATPILHDQATRGRVIEQLVADPDAIDVIHFACHGSFDPHNPLRSGIQLAPEPAGIPPHTADDPWVLRAEEILGMDLRADLVTLSACETGISERQPGDDLIGLTRALIFAGTPSVVVSLWKVNSLASQILMEHFYRALLAGATKAAALQQAQIATRQMSYSTVYAHVERHRVALAASSQPDDTWLAHILAMNLLALESERPASSTSDSWLPFAPIAYWAPFVLIGDWL